MCTLKFKNFFYEVGLFDLGGLRSELIERGQYYRLTMNYVKGVE